MQSLRNKLSAALNRAPAGNPLQPLSNQQRRSLMAQLTGADGNGADGSGAALALTALPPVFGDVQQGVSEFGAGLRTQLAIGIHELDATYQKFMRTRFDRLFGRARSQQLEEMSADDAFLLIGKYEKMLNRNMAFSTLGLVALVASTWLYPPALIIVIPPVFWLSVPIFQKAYQVLRYEHQVNYYVLGAVASAGVWIGGFYIPATFGSVLYYLVEKLLVVTQDRSYKGLANIFGQQPRTVWVLADGVEVEIPFAQVQPGDTVIVNAGQMLPVDGVIVAGMASIDQHALTGEAQPAEKTAGDPVLAATIVLAGKIQVRVEKAGQETVAAQIGAMLNRTASYQMTLQSKGMQVAHKSAPPTLLLGGVAWATIGLEQGLAILFSGFGVNIRLTSPITMLNFLNIASHEGILVKDGRSLELLGAVDTVVFDKTGTLTIELPHVTAIYPCAGLDEATVLAYAAAAEARQAHPIARAIVEAAAQRGSAVLAVESARYEVGYGIKVRIGDQVIRVGSDRFMAVEGIEIPAAIGAQQAECHSKGYSLVMVAVGDKLGGAIELQPTLRPEAKGVVDYLHARGLAVVIISGDQEGPTRQLAQALGIERYFANTLPENKALLVKQLQAEGRTVCFVGDGINDAVALKKAQVSISLRGATAIATDTAQIVLMDQTLQRLPQLFDIADEFADVLETGFVGALVPGVINIAGIFIFHWGLYASILIANLSLLSNLGIAMWPMITRRDNAVGRYVRTHRRSPGRRRSGAAARLVRRYGAFTRKLEPAKAAVAQLPAALEEKLHLARRVPKPSRRSVQLQSWAAGHLAGAPDVQQWLAALTAAELNVFAAQLAELYQQKELDFAWLDHTKLAADAALAQSMQQVVVCQAQAWMATPPAQDAASAWQVYLKFLRSPGLPANWAFGQRLHHELVDANLLLPMPDELAWAGDRARHTFVVRTLRAAAGQDPRQFHLVLMHVAAQGRPAPPAQKQGMNA